MVKEESRVMTEESNTLRVRIKQDQGKTSTVKIIQEIQRQLCRRRRLDKTDEWPILFLDLFFRPVPGGVNTPFVLQRDIPSLILRTLPVIRFLSLTKHHLELQNEYTAIVFLPACMGLWKKLLQCADGPFDR